MSNDRRGEIWFWLLLLSATLWIVWPLAFQSHIPAFRDGFHFYWPQLSWLDACYRAGEYFPLWNPNEGLGSNVSGQPTWQLYYPLRAIWLLPNLNLGQRYAIFVAVHLVVAALGIRFAGLSMKLSQPAAALAGLSFALSCPVVFQANNLVYLCSASWISWALVSLVRLSAWKADDVGAIWTFLRSCWWIAFCGAMMTLAGDPHSAVNFSLLVILYLLMRAAFAMVASWRLEGSRTSEKTNDEDRSEIAILRWQLPSWFLLTVCGLCLVLAIVQSCQVWSWYRTSSRAGRTVQVVDSYHSNVNSILIEPSSRTTHSIFDFSLSPWNLPTLIFPTITGNYSEGNSRWVQVVPSESRMWMPSIYFGIVPILLIFSAWRCCRLPAKWSRALSALVVFAMLAAMGNYSLAWLLRSLLDFVGLEGIAKYLPSDNSGGLYGLLVSLPGYEMFRYPAKWTVWATAGFSLLGGQALDRILNERDALLALPKFCLRFGFSVILLAALLAVALVSIGLSGNQVELSNWLSNRSDRLLGSPEIQASAVDILRALIQPAIVVLIVGVVWRFVHSKRPEARTKNARLEIGLEQTKGDRFAWILVALTTIELASVASCWFCTIDSARVAILKDTTESFELGRADRFVWANVAEADLETFQETQGSLLERSLSLQSEFMLGKLNHLAGVATLHASGSIEPQAVVALRRWLQTHDNLSETQPAVDAVLAELGVNHRLYRATDGTLKWKRLENARPLCELIDPTGKNVSEARILWHWESSSRLTLQIECPKNCTLIVRQLNDGGWMLRGSGEKLTIDPNQLLITASLSTGTHELNLQRAK